ncbi:VOC family protein [Lacisediminihabitans profunda]|uniref:VOC family protein n=1 Tax=Lacisediminihabitans profunda TaxID=2594790 RepID=A0A5C8UM30_9MICO|nr:VOC family protein [Lacisediminihabitans profunda]TXN29383.1 VOC family protein [Lacisediminihabitans profunda]
MVGLPGLRGTEHIGFTVPDLDEAERFFVDVIGCELVYSLGPFERADDWMQTNLGVHPRTVMRELRFFRCGFGPNFEIFQYEAADGQRPEPRNSDIGGHHLAFYVDDFDEALAYLLSRGVEVMGEPTASSSHSTGQRWIYFRSPWGMQFELVSYPQGKAYEATAPVKLWHPARPAE